MIINKNPQSNLPPGFRFHPTDEELILHYLRKKVRSSSSVPTSIIADVDIYKFDPWDLPAKALFGEKEWYFFSPRDRKYPNGARPNRAAASGYWKATGTDKVITATVGGGFQENVGVKKALVFYKGKPPKGVKTSWIMHEYRLTETQKLNTSNNISFQGLKSKDSSMRLDHWVLCRIYNKPHASSSSPVMIATSDQEQEQELVIDQKTLLPNLADNNNTLKSQRSFSFSNLLDAVDLSSLSSLLLENPEHQMEFEFPPWTDAINRDYALFTGHGSNTNDYLDQKLPQLSSMPVEKFGNDINKRQRTGCDEETMNPLKKMMSTCTHNNTIDQLDHSMIHQPGFLNQSFLSQQQFLFKF